MNKPYWIKHHQTSSKHQEKGGKCQTEPPYVGSVRFRPSKKDEPGPKCWPPKSVTRWSIWTWDCSNMICYPCYALGLWTVKIIWTAHSDIVETCAKHLMLGNVSSFSQILDWQVFVRARAWALRYLVMLPWLQTYLSPLPAIDRAAAQWTQELSRTHLFRKTWFNHDNAYGGMERLSVDRWSKACRKHLKTTGHLCREAGSDPRINPHESHFSIKIGNLLMVSTGQCMFDWTQERNQCTLSRPVLEEPCRGADRGDGWASIPMWKQELVRMGRGWNRVRRT